MPECTQSPLRVIKSAKQWNINNGAWVLPQEIVVQEIKSKFVYLIKERNRDYDFTSKDQKLREIDVWAIKWHL